MESMDLFSSAAQNQEKTAGINSNRPLSVRMRPQNFDEYIGQKRIKNNLKLAIDAAKKRGEPVDHILLYGPPGLGKTHSKRIAGRWFGNLAAATGGRRAQLLVFALALPCRPGRVR